MQTVRFPKIGIDVNFERKADSLVVSIDTPTARVNGILQKMREFKERIQFFPGLSFIYHIISKLEEAIVAALEEPPKP